VRDLGEAEAAGRVVAAKLDTAVLVKGGHLGGDESIDILLHAGDEQAERNRQEKRPVPDHCSVMSIELIRSFWRSWRTTANPSVTLPNWL